VEGSPEEATFKQVSGYNQANLRDGYFGKGTRTMKLLQDPSLLGDVSIKGINFNNGQMQLAPQQTGIWINNPYNSVD
jgi:hypothetical protein